MKTMWIVRAGEGGYLIDQFARGFVAIGWNELGDLGSVSSQDEVKLPPAKPGAYF